MLTTIFRSLSEGIFVAVGHDRDDPANDAAGSTVHPRGKSRPYSDFLFVSFTFDGLLNGYADKEVKLVVITLKDLANHERAFAFGKVSILGSPFPNSFSCVADDLLWDMGKEAIDGLSTVGNSHVIAGFRARGRFPHA